ncbi:hypothetical protein NFC81_15385 [Salinispirillum sp. LH 10-3-1]|uniref:Uncharacterized protein n=1 Tax=Salinispirillum sp. LH 10-3-1 TaxID=2952525 RepID=A0AB38YFF4_9GAMM
MCAWLVLVACSAAPAPGSPPAGAVLATYGDPTIEERPDFTARGWPVHVDFHRLYAARASDRIDDFLRLPDDTVLAFAVNGTEGEPPTVWRGQLLQDNLHVTSLTLSRAGQRLAASFTVNNQRYSLITRQDGVVVLWADDTPLPKESPTLLAPE